MTDTCSETDKPQSAAPFLLTGRFRIRRLNDAHTLSTFLAESCPNPRMAIIGINEILVNAIEHGNLGISYEEKSRLQIEDNWLAEIDRRLNLPQHLHQYVTIEITRYETELWIQVTDQGKGFDWQQYQTTNPQDPLSMHGRGILMAKSLAFKKLEYSGIGNVVTCIISLVE